MAKCTGKKQIAMVINAELPDVRLLIPLPRSIHSLNMLCHHFVSLYYLITHHHIMFTVSVSCAVIILIVTKMMYGIVYE